MEENMRKVLAVLFIALVACSMIFAQAATETEKAPTELVIWAACQEKEAQNLVAAFNEIHPEIKVSIIRAGASELNNRLVAEWPSPSGDIMLGASQEIFDAPDQVEMFVPYRVANDANIPANLKDSKSEVPRYYSFSMPIQVLLVNTDMLKEEDYPKTWWDLGDPKYKGKIILGNPALSGGAYAQLYMMWKLYGYDLIPKVAANATYVPSSSTVTESVTRGEYAIGANPEYNVSSAMKKGAHIIAIYPEDGTGLRTDGSGIIKNGPNLAAAKLFMEFLTTEQAYKIIRETAGRRVPLESIPGPDFMPSLSEIKFFEYDAVEAGDVRDELTEYFTNLIVQ
ncbi:MAG TPA: ABC transporter substrate-binding protein [Sphaerochaeta sp.]|nr:ABC transporter substrate-binding protein [Sphaerochaeta sp.]